jgi:hypothetical protein
MYEPTSEKYYANDVEFDSLEDAKNFIDSGEISNDIKEAYRKGLFAKGGKAGDYYIEYLNKDKKFQKDVKYFTTYEKAVEWARKNFERFDPDMIRQKYSEGGKAGVEYNVFDDENKLVFSGSEQEIIDEANTIFYYDIKDNDAEEFVALHEALEAFESMGYSVEKI